MTKLIEAVRAHAKANYGRDGWDYVVECFEDSELEELINEEKAKTEKQAIAAVAKTVKLLAEREREVRAGIF